MALSGESCASFSVPQSKCSVLCMEVSIKEWTLALFSQSAGQGFWTKTAVFECSRNSSGDWGSGMVVVVVLLVEPPSCSLTSVRVSSPRKL